LEVMKRAEGNVTLIEHARNMMVSHLPKLMPLF
jgi:hypothetical protein